jgi:hypothetical protein
MLHGLPLTTLRHGIGAYRHRARPKARPAAAPSGYCRLRHDHVDKGGKVSIRHAGRMHHLGIGIARTAKEILAVTDTATATVIELRTGKSCPSTTSTPPAATGATSKEARARWPGLPVT